MTGRWLRTTLDAMSADQQVRPAAHFIIDQTYLSALGRPGHLGRHFRTYWLWLGAGVMAVWSAAVGCRRRA